MRDISKIDPSTVTHTESAILAFLNHYGSVNRKSVSHYFGLKGEHSFETMEHVWLGKTFVRLCAERKQVIEEQFVL